MHRSKLIETLKCLTLDEIDQLGKFLKHPLFHVEPLDESALALFDYLKTFFGNWEHPNLHRDFAYAHLFPNSPVIKGRLEKTMTRLLRQVRRFVVFEMQHTNEDTSLELIYLVRFFEKRGNTDEFERHLATAREVLRNEPIKDTQHYFKAYQIEESATTHFAWFNDHKSDLNIDPTLLALNAHFVSVQLDYWILHLYQTRNVPMSQPKHLIAHDTLETMIAQLPLHQMPGILVHYKAYLLLYNQLADTQLFTDFTHTLKMYKWALSPEKYKDYLTLVRTYGIQEYNRGNHAFFSITFEMYREHLQNGYLYHDGMIHASVLKNLISMGLRLGEHTWVQSMLEEHKNCISGVSNPNEVYKFNLALCHFHVAQYDSVLDLLSYDYEEVFYKIAAKRLEIKALYEVQSPLLEARLEAFNILIFRTGTKQMAETYANANKHFGAFLRRIISPGTLHNHKRRQKLCTEIAQSATVVEREWLLDILVRQTSPPKQNAPNFKPTGSKLGA
jgi:hypothetical protein